MSLRYIISPILRMLQAFYSGVHSTKTMILSHIMLTNETHNNVVVTATYSKRGRIWEKEERRAEQIGVGEKGVTAPEITQCSLYLNLDQSLFILSFMFTLSLSSSVSLSLSFSFSSCGVELLPPDGQVVLSSRNMQCIEGSTLFRSGWHSGALFLLLLGQFGLDEP